MKNFVKAFIAINLFSASYANASISELFSEKPTQDICNAVIDSGAEYAPLFTSNPQANTLYVAQRKAVYGIFSEAQQALSIAEFDEKIHGLKYSDGKLWVLFRDSITVLGARSGKILFTVTSNSYGGTPDRHQRAYDFDIFNGRVFIAHGAYGLVVIDENNGKILLTESFGLDRQPYGHRSKVMSISINDEAAILGVDNITQPSQAHRALNGLIKFNPNSPKEHTRHQYDPTPNKAGIIAYARMQLEGAKLFINNLGNLQLFDTNSLRKTIVPTWRRLSVDLHGRDRNVRPMGELYVENDKVYGCGTVYLGDVEGKPDLIPYTINGQ